MNCSRRKSEPERLGEAAGGQRLAEARAGPPAARARRPGCRPAPAPARPACRPPPCRPRRAPRWPAGRPRAGGDVMLASVIRNHPSRSSLCVDVAAAPGLGDRRRGWSRNVHSCSPSSARARSRVRARVIPCRAAAARRPVRRAGQRRGAKRFASRCAPPRRSSHRPTASRRPSPDAVEDLAGAAASWRGPSSSPRRRPDRGSRRPVTATGSIVRRGPAAAPPG